MSAFQSAEPKRAFSLGFLLILLMPTDIVAVISRSTGFMTTTTTFCTPAARGRQHAADGPPILSYLLLGRRARSDARIRDWLTTNAWVVNLVVIVYFIYQLVK